MCDLIKHTAITAANENIFPIKLVHAKMRKTSRFQYFQFLTHSLRMQCAREQVDYTVAKYRCSCSDIVPDKIC